MGGLTGESSWSCSPMAKRSSPRKRASHRRRPTTRRAAPNKRITPSSEEAVYKRSQILGSPLLGIWPSALKEQRIEVYGPAQYDERDKKKQQRDFHYRSFAMIKDFTNPQAVLEACRRSFSRSNCARPSSGSCQLDATNVCVSILIITGICVVLGTM